MYTALTNGALVNDLFQLINLFEIVVSEYYNHSRRLYLFGRKHRKSFNYHNEAITDKKYANVTTKLKPGRKFWVKVFQIKDLVTAEDCITKLRAEKAILVGAQGATLVWEQKKEGLPINRRSVSFDEEDALWQDSSGNHGVPHILYRACGDYQFNLTSFKDNLNRAYCLLCFCDDE